MSTVEVWLNGCVITFNAQTVAEDQNISTMSDHYQFHNRKGEIVMEASVRWNSQAIKSFREAVVIFKNSDKDA